MTGKEALRILCECANGEKKLLFSDSLDLGRIVSKELDELTKYKRAFEILKEKFEIELDYGYPDSDYNDMFISGDTEYTLNGEIQITKEQYELLEELMKGENN